MPPAPTQMLSIFLMREGVGGIGEILVDRSYRQYEVHAPGGGYAGVLMVAATSARRPKWVAFFEPSVSEPIDVTTKSSAAAFVLPVGGRTFVLTFGFGRLLLKPGVWEENFGLRVTLNCVARTKIRSIDKKTFEAIGRHTREQTSREATFDDFGLDIEQDLLRAVTGGPVDPEMGVRLAGMDSLAATARVSIASLPALLERYLGQYNSDAYKEQYPWLDQIGEVRRRDEIDRLDALLLRQIRTGAHERIWLAAPDIVDWAGVSGFRYSQSLSAPEYPDLRLGDYLEWRDPAGLTVQRLKGDCAYCFMADTDQAHERWTIYKSTHAEIEHAGTTFVLSGGLWYRVAPSFVERIDRAYARIPETQIDLPEYADADEGAFNTRVAAGSKGKLALMDRQLIRCSGRSPVELCDLFTDGRVLIHVKRYGGSSSLSHLFSQGVVAARMLLMDGEFRLAATEALPESHRSLVGEPFDPRHFEVAFGVVSRSTGALTLPFFSRVNLKNAHELLRQFGYRVSVKKIAVARGNP